MAMQKKMIMVFRESQQNSESSTVPVGGALSGLMPRVNLLSYNETLRRRQWGKGRMRNKERRKTNMKRNTLRKKRNGRTTRTNKWKKRKKTT